MTAAGAEQQAAAAARWSRHVASLDVRADVPLHGAASRWYARDEYAHLARWMAVAAARVRAARDGRPPPDLGGDPHLRWQAEDHALELAIARRQAAETHAALLDLAMTLPAGEAGDGLRALAAGDLVAHFDAHVGFIVEGMLADEQSLWTELLTQLDAEGPEQANVGAGAGWSAGEMFAHLARWFDFAERSLEAFRDGRRMPDVPDVDETNRVWLEADRALASDVARKRALDGRERVLALAPAITPAQWSAAALNRFDGNTVGHYVERLGHPSD